MPLGIRERTLSRAKGNCRRQNSHTALVVQSRNTSAHTQDKPRPLAHGGRGCSSFAPEHDRSLGATLRTNSAPWTATSNCTSTALMLQFGKQRASMGSNQTANTCTIEVRRVETKVGLDNLRQTAERQYQQLRATHAFPTNSVVNKSNEH